MIVRDSKFENLFDPLHLRGAKMGGKKKLSLFVLVVRASWRKKYELFLMGTPSIDQMIQVLQVSN